MYQVSPMNWILILFFVLFFFFNFLSLMITFEMNIFFNKFMKKIYVK